jgi:hypothetical protein
MFQQLFREILPIKIQTLLLMNNTLILVVNNIVNTFLKNILQQFLIMNQDILLHEMKLYFQMHSLLFSDLNEKLIFHIGSFKFI